MGLTTNTIPRTIALLNQIQDHYRTIGVGGSRNIRSGKISIHAFHLTRDVLDDAIGQSRGVARDGVLHLFVRATDNGVVGVVPLAFYATGAREVPVIEGVETTRHEENEGLYSWRAFGSASSRAQFEGN